MTDKTPLEKRIDDLEAVKLKMKDAWVNMTNILYGLSDAGEVTSSDLTVTPPDKSEKRFIVETPYLAVLYTVSTIGVIKPHMIAEVSMYGTDNIYTLNSLLSSIPELNPDHPGHLLEDTLKDIVDATLEYESIRAILEPWIEIKERHDSVNSAKELEWEEAIAEEREALDIRNYGPDS